MQHNGDGSSTGKYTATKLRSVYYGQDSIKQLHTVLEDIMPKDADHKILIITGKSLAKTPVIPEVEDILKQKNAYACTFAKMRQHTPIDDIEEALDIVHKEGREDTMWKFQA